MNIAKKYGGYIVILLVIYGWTSGLIGVGALAILSAVAFIYTLFQAPMWCGAPTRQNQHCRNNADGVLRGCWIREHRWQKTKMLVRSDSWGRLFGRLFSGINGATATISALGTFFSGIAAVIGLAVNEGSAPLSCPGQVDDQESLPVPVSGGLLLCSSAPARRSAAV